ncbi:hypothetical protein AIOGIFDO_01347 [Candidatus Methanoperedenaceae archaeon GB37]|nr:hypothetical protein AIOGIFDO_01347 [Candidatus Methanoperedenaceae archaeon GB37]
MNIKRLRIPIAVVAAMAVLTLLASSAAAMITVDGDPTDWSSVTPDIHCTDPDEGDVSIEGYDISSLWGVIEGNTLYVRIDVYGVAGDADDDGSNTDIGSSQYEKPGVGEGAPQCSYEQYYVDIDSDNDGDVDYVLNYCKGDSYLFQADGTTEIPGAVTAAAHRPTSGPGPYHTVELSVSIDGTNCDIDPDDYCLRGWADTQAGGAEDNTGKECYHHMLPPTAVLSGYGCVPGAITLSGCGSRANEPGATIVKYEWDFDNDGVYDEETSSCTTTPPWTEPGDYTVGLRVTDSNGLTGVDVDTIHVPPCPEVPAIGPIGLVALIGLLGIFGAGMIVRRR